MLLATVAIVFAVLVVLSMPIVFALGIAGIAGLLIGGYPLQQLSSALVSGSQSWVLLAIPAFVFAGNLMERCGMSHALVELARALIGWVKGGLGMSVIVVAYFFSDICGSKMAEVSALGSALMPPLTKAGYDRRDSASLIAAGTAMGMLVPPAIFMIVIAQVTNTSAVALFVAGFVPAMVIMLCLMIVVYVRARQNDWPVDARPSLKQLGHAALHAAVPMVVPFVILAGFILGIITATEAGAVVAGYAFLAAKLYYRNVSWREMGRIAYDSAILTAAVVFLLAIASVYQYLMGVSGVPQLLGQVLGPLKTHPWLFLIGTAAMSCLFGMVLEGLPAAVVLIPVVFPISEDDGHRPDSLQYRADRRGRHRPVHAADGSRAIDGASLCEDRRRPALPDLCAVHAGSVRRTAADHLRPRDQPDAAAACGIDQVAARTAGLPVDAPHVARGGVDIDFHIAALAIPAFDFPFVAEKIRVGHRYEAHVGRFIHGRLHRHDTARVIGHRGRGHSERHRCGNGHNVFLHLSLLIEVSSICCHAHRATLPRTIATARCSDFRVHETAQIFGNARPFVGGFRATRRRAVRAAQTTPRARKSAISSAP